MMEHLEEVCPCFVPFVQEALKTEIDGGVVELAKVRYESSFNYQDDSSEPKGHYFTFKLPYAGNTVEWEVLFDRKQPTKAPDFVLCGPEYMVCDPSMYSRVVQTWNTQDPLCLSKLLPILKFLYSEHQVLLVKQFPRIDQIYRDLLENGIEDDHIEIHVDQKAKKVNLLIKLNLDWNCISGLPKTKVPDCHVFVGLLCTLGINGNHMSQSLIMSPYMESLFGQSLNDLIKVNLPNSLATDHVFVKKLTESFNQALYKIYDKHCMCRHMVAAVHFMYPGLVYTYDQDTFRYVGLTFIIKGDRYVVKLEIEDNNSNDSMQYYLILVAMDKPMPSHDGLVYSDRKKLNISSPSRNTERVAFAKLLNEEITRVFSQFISEAASVSQ